MNMRTLLDKLLGSADWGIHPDDHRGPRVDSHLGPIGRLLDLALDHAGLDRHHGAAQGVYSCDQRFRAARRDGVFQVRIVLPHARGAGGFAA